jgi:hypothetical protein
MKSRGGRFIVTVLLATVIETCGTSIGGVIGNLLSIFAGVVLIYAIVEVFKKPKAPPTVSS